MEKSALLNICKIIGKTHSAFNVNMSSLEQEINKCKLTT